MTWAHPEMLGWLLGVAALAVGALVAQRHHHARLAQRFPHGFDREVLPAAVRRRRALALSATLASLACVVIALAEPLTQDEEIEIAAEGVDIVLVVDLSRSMDATDVEPSRLERARREIQDLSERLTGDRVGLVIFAGGAYPRLPLTSDHRALELVVRELHTKVFQAQGSNLGDAIREALGLLELADSGAGQAIIVLSDGEIHRPDHALAAADEAASAGVRVYGWLIGQQAAPIPDGQGGFVVDPRTRERVLSTPTPDTLQAIAQRTGGAVVRSVAGTSDAEALYDREIRQRLATAVGQRGTRRISQSAVGLPLALAVALALLGAWLGDGRRVALTLILAFVTLSSPTAQAQSSSLREADALLRAGQSEQAARRLEALVAEAPDDPDLLQRLGVARYRAGDPRGAAEAFERAARSGDPDALFNAGNAWWRSGLLERARERYEQALERDPQHPFAPQNLEAVQRAIAERAISPPPPPPEADQPGQPSEQGDGEDDPDAPEPTPGTADGDAEAPDGAGDQDQEGRPGDQGSGSAEGAPPPSGDQEGQPQQGQADPDGQDSPDGPPQAPADGPSSGEAPDGGDGTRSDAGELEDLDDLAERTEGLAGGQAEDGDPSTAPPSDGGGGSPLDGQIQPAGGEDVDRQQAERILDSVEEGRPRIYIPGASREPPW